MLDRHWKTFLQFKRGILSAHKFVYGCQWYRFNIMYPYESILPTCRSAWLFRIVPSFKCQWGHSVVMVNSFKTIHQWPTTQREGTNHRTSSMATVRTETTRGPTYSMTRAIGATPWWKGSSVDAIVCVVTIAHSQWKSHSSHGLTSPMATSMSMSARVQPQCRQSCKAHGVLDLCACSNCTD